MIKKWLPPIAAGLAVVAVTVSVQALRATSPSAPEPAAAPVSVEDLSALIPTATNGTVRYRGISVDGFDGAVAAGPAATSLVITDTSTATMVLVGSDGAELLRRPELTGVAIAAPDSSLIAWSASGRAFVADATTGEVLANLTHDDLDLPLATYGDEVFFTDGSDRTFVWNRSGAIDELEYLRGSIIADVDLNHVAARNGLGDLRVHDRATGELVGEMTDVGNVAFSPDGQHMAGYTILGSGVGPDRQGFIATLDGTVTHRGVAPNAVSIAWADTRPVFTSVNMTGPAPTIVRVCNLPACPATRLTPDMAPVLTPDSLAQILSQAS